MKITSKFISVSAVSAMVLLAGCTDPGLVNPDDPNRKAKEDAKLSIYCTREVGGPGAEYDDVAEAEHPDSDRPKRLGAYAPSKEEITKIMSDFVEKEVAERTQKLEEKLEQFQTHTNSGELGKVKLAVIRYKRQRDEARSEHKKTADKLHEVMQERDWFKQKAEGAEKEGRVVEDGLVVEEAKNESETRSLLFGLFSHKIEYGSHHFRAQWQRQ